MVAPNANSSQPPVVFVPNAFRPFWQPNSRPNTLPFKFALPDQDDTVLRTQLESVSQKLDTAEKKINEYSQLIASLCIDLKRYQDTICNGCREKIFRATTAPPTPPQFTQSTSEEAASTTLSEPVTPPDPRHPPDPSGNTEPHRSVLIASTSVDDPQGAIVHFPDTITSPYSSDAESEPSEPATPSSPGITDRVGLTLPNSSDWSVEYNPEIRQSLHLNVANTFTFKDTVVCVVTFSRDGEYLATGLSNGETHVYNMITGSKSVLVQRSATVFYTDVAKVSRAWPVQAVRFSSDNNYLAIAGPGPMGRINMWEIGRRRVCAIFEDTNLVTSLDWSPDGRLLVSASLSSVSLWSRRGGSRRTLSEPAGLIEFMSVAFNPDGRFVAVGKSRDTVLLWNTRTGQLVANYKIESNSFGFLNVIFTPDGKGIATGVKSLTTLQCWDFSSLKGIHDSRQLGGMLEDGFPHQMKQIFEFKRDENPVNIIHTSFKFDSRWVVGSFGHDVCLLDARTGTWVCTLKGHVREVRTVDFSPAGRYIASGGLDGHVRLWTYDMVE